MSNGGSGFEPHIAEVLAKETLVPISVEISHTVGLSDDLEGAKLSTVVFECKPLGSGEDGMTIPVKFLMPTDTFISVATSLSQSALAVISDRQA